MEKGSCIEYQHNSCPTYKQRFRCPEYLRTCRNWSPDFITSYLSCDCMSVTSLCTERTSKEMARYACKSDVSNGHRIHVTGNVPWHLDSTNFPQTAVLRRGYTAA